MKLPLALALAVMRVGDESLAPAGCTLREMLWIDVYAAALYVRPRVPPAAALPDPHQPKALRMVILDRRFMPPELPKKWQKALEGELDRAAMDRLREVYRELDRGDTITVSYLPGPGLRLEVNDQPVASTTRHELVDTLLRAWAGDAPVNERIRLAVARNPC